MRKISEDELIRINYNISSVYKRTDNKFFTLNELIFYGPFDTMHIYTKNHQHTPYMYQIIEINDYEIKTRVESEQGIKFFSIPFKSIEFIVLEKKKGI